MMAQKPMIVTALKFLPVDVNIFTAVKYFMFYKLMV